MDAAGRRERAREAIRIYFTRVENANRHFTSEVEGWRTDRGLVHIIFGTPNSTKEQPHRDLDLRRGEQPHEPHLQLHKRKGPFSDNDLVLKRDAMLKGAWYRNVESWRNGRVYQN
ncbi:MAG: GWxTD domain-containing protein [Flavobacteriales bacterium]|nr:GWxTD domain-containing protein [Flavobacteriales bacterium]